ncbi:hypothetical protein ACSCB1_35470 [Streptomyces europaeiscabiei]|uniref:hypothetical protein n=1 Tax=Streptomyces europaeiscabiei TaxID=146819 RepID=UPI0006286908|nr:hypothetical protein [Streptomyces europaeiscabiei]
MAKKTITVSDVTGEDITEDAVEIIVLEHPSIDEPVKLDAANGDLEELRKNQREYAILEVVNEDGARERITVPAADFNELIQGDAEDVLADAEPYVSPAAKQAPAPRKSPEEKLDYKTLAYAGRPHRGKTTDEEKQMVRENLDQVNANLKAAGIRTIELSNPDHVARYDLQELAKEAGHTIDA